VSTTDDAQRREQVLGLNRFPYPPEPLSPAAETRRPPGTPTGEVIEVELPVSTIYPGAAHRCAIYVPPGVGDGPLPYIVALDGQRFLGDDPGLPATLDHLIAAGDIPPMLAICVDPGVTPPSADRQTGRAERSYEYDTLGDRFVRFLTDEVLPEVGRHHPLSEDPEDHAIMGLSTGAVAAFIAAWTRPDVFRRVVSFVGTFLAMRGADTLSALVRKTEARPLRVWLQSGEWDHRSPDHPYGTFYAGSWPLASILLYEALQFSGYDVHLDHGGGEHDLHQAAATLPDCLRWLWRGHDGQKPTIVARPPAALGVGTWQERGSVWATIHEAGDWQRRSTPSTVRSLTTAADGALLAVTADGAVLREGPSGLEETGLRTGGPIAPGEDQVVYTADHRARTILAHGPEGSEVLVTDVRAHALHGDRAGGLYWLETSADGATGAVGGGTGSADGGTSIGFRGRDGAVTRVPGPAGASALSTTTDGAILVVATADGRRQWSYMVRPDGTPADGEGFYRLEVLEDEVSACDVTTDTLGQAYFATDIGIQVCEQIGRVAMILPGPVVHRPVASVEFCGAARDHLATLQDGAVYVRPMRTRGAVPGQWVQPPEPPL
jgi:gluconolactonase